MSWGREGDNRPTVPLLSASPYPSLNLGYYLGLQLNQGYPPSLNPKPFSPSPPPAAAFHGNRLITVGDAGAVFIWDLDGSPPVPPVLPAAGPAHRTAAVAAAPATRQWLPASSTSLKPSQLLAAADPDDDLPPAVAGPITLSPRTDMALRGPPSSGFALLLPSDVRGGGVASSPTRSSSVSLLGPSVGPRPASAPRPAGDGRSSSPQRPPAASLPLLLGPQPAAMCASVLGFTPSGGENVVWRPEAGVFAYAVDNMAVIEDLASRKQRWGTCGENGHQCSHESRGEKGSSHQAGPVCPRLPRLPKPLLL